MSVIPDADHAEPAETPVGHELQEHVFVIRRPPANDFARRHADDSLVTVQQERPQELNRCTAFSPGGDSQQPQAAVEAFAAYRPEEHEPDPGRHQIYNDAYGRYREVYFALKPVFERA